MLSYGETSVIVSFYCHNKRGNELDLSVIKAAQDVGIRLFFGRMNYDIVRS
jgi:5-methylthioadenosine/S-adenosylhomocysteine deaminase